MGACSFLPAAAVAVVSVLSLVLLAHLWERYEADTVALGFSGVYERFLGFQLGGYSTERRVCRHVGFSSSSYALSELSCCPATAKEMRSTWLSQRQGGAGPRGARKWIGRAVVSVARLRSESLDQASVDE